LRNGYWENTFSKPDVDLQGVKLSHARECTMFECVRLSTCPSPFSQLTVGPTILQQSMKGPIEVNVSTTKLLKLEIMQSVAFNHTNNNYYGMTNHQLIWLPL